MIDVRQLRAVMEGKTILAGIDCQVRAGEFVGVLGPNGAGKSTLLRCLLGLTPAAAGRVSINGRSIDSMSRREMARQLAFVPQAQESDGNFAVADLVAMGRTPYLGRFSPMNAMDQAAIDAAVAATNIQALLDRQVGSLSGGERQRVLLARALAQTTPILLLDEPTANLDLFHELVAVQMLASLAAQGKTIIAVLHDVNLAARYCDRLLLLSEGRLVAFGPPIETLTSAALREVFRIDAPIRTHAPTGAIVVETAHANPIDPYGK